MEDRQDRRRYKEDAPYRQSRAVERSIYGPRSIDGSTRMADPSRNLPMSQPSLTPQGGAGGWDAMFHGMKSPVASRTPEYGGTFGQSRPGPSALSSQNQVDEDTAFGGGTGSMGTATPSSSSLPLLAAGGVPKHTDTWGGGGYVPPVNFGGADPLMTPKPFMPGQQGAWKGAPKPATGPLGNKLTDLAGMAQNRSLYAPGGGAGLWGGSESRSASPWKPAAGDFAIAKFDKKRTWGA